MCQLPRFSIARDGNKVGQIASIWTCSSLELNPDARAHNAEEKVWKPHSFLAFVNERPQSREFKYPIDAPIGCCAPIELTILAAMIPENLMVILSAAAVAEGLDIVDPGDG